MAAAAVAMCWDFEHVYAAHLPLVRAVTISIVGKTDWEDVAQNVWLKVYRGLPRFRGESKLSTWIGTIARNQCYETLRRTQALRRARLDFVGTAEELNWKYEPPDPQALDAELELIRRGEYDRVYRQRFQLSLLDKAIFDCVVDGATYCEIAREYRLTLPAIKARLFRVRRKLREAA